MNRLYLVGSPRLSGRCMSLAMQLFEECIQDCPEDQLVVLSVSSLSIKACTGCGACNKNNVRCAQEDDMNQVYEQLEAADEVVVISPVYFSGPPAQFKALLDRLQPYWQESAKNRAQAEKQGEHFKTAHKPAVLHVVGEGGNPQGYSALVDIVQSALAVAGFKLELIYDWVGKISPHGDILEEAQLLALAPNEESIAED